MRRERKTMEGPPGRWIVWSGIGVAVLCSVLWFGCSDPGEVSCDEQGDCFETEVCEDGFCQSIDNAEADDGQPVGAEDAVCGRAVEECVGLDGQVNVSAGVESIGCDSEHEEFEAFSTTTDELRLCSGELNSHSAAFFHCDDHAVEATVRVLPVDACPEVSLMRELELTGAVLQVSQDCDDYLIDCPFVDDQGALVSRIRLDAGGFEATGGMTTLRWELEENWEGTAAFDYRMDVNIEKFDED